MSAKNTIVLKQGVTRREFVAGGTITPGHMCKFNSSNEVVVHATAGGYGLPMFAIEDELQGKIITDNYAATNRVQLFIAQRGDEVQALLKANENVVIGDPLESAGDGTLQKHVANTADIYTSAIVGYVLEASNVATVAKVAVLVA